MRRKLLIPLLAVGLLLVGAGCGKKAAGPAGQPAEKPVAAKPLLSSDACNHPYYPLKKGYQIDYEVNAAGGNMTYSMKIPEAASGSAKLELDINYQGSHTMTMDLVCGADGNIRTDAYMDMAGAFGSPFKITTKSVDGEIMPRDLKVGTKWSNKYETEMDLSGMANLPKGYEKMSGTVEETSEVVGEESVTVPAGTFDALKVQMTTVSNYVMAGPNAQPQVTRGSTTQWWVKGVGMVKQEDTAAKQVISATKIINP